jgi:hypothetical protein
MVMITKGWIPAKNDMWRRERQRNKVKILGVIKNKTGKGEKWMATQ